MWFFLKVTCSFRKVINQSTKIVAKEIETELNYRENESHARYSEIDFKLAEFAAQPSYSVVCF